MRKKELFDAIKERNEAALRRLLLQLFPSTIILEQSFLPGTHQVESWIGNHIFHLRNKNKLDVEDLTWLFSISDDRDSDWFRSICGQGNVYIKGLFNILNALVSRNLFPASKIFDLLFKRYADGWCFFAIILNSHPTCVEGLLQLVTNLISKANNEVLFVAKLLESYGGNPLIHQICTLDDETFICSFLELIAQWHKDDKINFEQLYSLLLKENSKGYIPSEVVLERDKHTPNQILLGLLNETYNTDPSFVHKLLLFLKHSKNSATLLQNMLAKNLEWDFGELFKKIYKQKPKYLADLLETLVNSKKDTFRRLSNSTRHTVLYNQLIDMIYHFLCVHRLPSDKTTIRVNKCLIQSFTIDHLWHAWRHPKYQDTFQHMLDILRELAKKPEVLRNTPALLKPISDWSLFHIVARYQTPQNNISFLNFINRLLNSYEEQLRFQLMETRAASLAVQPSTNEAQSELSDTNIPSSTSSVQDNQASLMTAPKDIPLKALTISYLFNPLERKPYYPQLLFKHQNLEVVTSFIKSIEQSTFNDREVLYNVLYAFFQYPKSATNLTLHINRTDCPPFVLNVLENQVARLYKFRNELTEREIVLLKNLAQNLSAAANFLLYRTNKNSNNKHEQKVANDRFAKAIEYGYAPAILERCYQQQSSFFKNTELNTYYEQHTDNKSFLETVESCRPFFTEDQYIDILSAIANLFSSTVVNLQLAEYYYFRHELKLAKDFYDRIAIDDSTLSKDDHLNLGMARWQLHSELHDTKDLYYSIKHMGLAQDDGFRFDNETTFEDYPYLKPIIFCDDLIIDMNNEALKEAYKDFRDNVFLAINRSKPTARLSLSLPSQENLDTVTKKATLACQKVMLWLSSTDLEAVQEDLLNYQMSAGSGISFYAATFEQKITPHLEKFVQALLNYHKSQIKKPIEPPAPVSPTNT